MGGCTVKLTRMAALLTLCLVLPVAAAVAADLQVPALPSAIPGPPSAPQGVLALDVDTAYEMALNRNLNLQVGRYNIAAANAGILSSVGIFDPALRFSLSGSGSTAPAATQLAGGLIINNRNTTFGLGIDQLLPTGTMLSVESSAARSETNNTFVFVNPRWDTDLTVSLRQPLLNGFGTLVNRSGIVIARNARAQNAETFEINVVSTLQQVDSAYWNLVGARRAVEVAEQSLELAQRLLNETRERVKVGTSAPIDLVQSEAGVATRRQRLIAARNAASNAEDVLKGMLGFNEPAEWTRKIETTQTYEFKPLDVDLRQSIETALQERPEIRQQQLQLDLLQFQVKVARNRTLPGLDLTATYGYGGLGGNTLSETPSGEPLPLKGGFEDAGQQILSRDFPHWTMGAQFSLPIGNNEAQGQLAEQRYYFRQGEVSMAALKQSVIQEVRYAVRSLSDGAAEVDAAVASRDLAQRNLEAEQTKFNNGLSTNYQVLQIQDDLAQAQLSLIQASLAYRKALLAYRTSTGTLLDTLNVQIEDPGSPEVPHDYWKNVKWLQFDGFGRATPAEAPEGPGETTAATE
jgi:outer membrane protein